MVSKQQVDMPSAKGSGDGFNREVGAETSFLIRRQVRVITNPHTIFQDIGVLGSLSRMQTLCPKVTTHLHVYSCQNNPMFEKKDRVRTPLATAVPFVLVQQTSPQNLAKHHSGTSVGNARHGETG